jgi:surface-anchored protein
MHACSRILLSAFVAIVSCLAVWAADPTPLVNSHVDIRIIDRPGESNRLGLVVLDSDSGKTYLPEEAILVAPTAARNEIPPGFEVFGEVGAPLWILPQSQDPALLYLGVSAEELPQGVFSSRFAIELVRVDGPGDFFLWQFDTFSNLVMGMNSRDGISTNDLVRPLLGGHEHFNWGFNASGYYEVVMRVTNSRTNGTNVVFHTSGEIPLRFGVQPYTIPTPAIAATLSRPAWTEGTLTCELTGTPNRAYPLETSEDLIRWTPAGTATPDNAGRAVISLPAAAPGLFLRARTP